MLSRCASLDRCGLFRVLDVTRRLSVPTEVDELLEMVLDAALAVLGAERGTVFLFDKQANELYAKVATGSKEIRFPANHGIAGETAQSRQLINVPDCYADPRFNQEIDRKTGFRTRELLSIPLIGIDDSLVGVLQVLNKRNGTFSLDDEHLGHTLAAQCAVALQRALLLEDRIVKQKMERDLAVARDIQQAVLPKEVPECPGYDIACWSRPADDTGGDIFDAIGLADNRIALLLGDATGHGIGPALSVTQMRAMFRMGLRGGGELKEIGTHIDRQLKEDLPGNRFITSFLGILHAEKHRIEYLSFGQGPLIHYHAASGEVQFMGASGLPMGMPINLPVELPEPIAMEPGDIVGIITDGFFEYADSSGEEFGKERVGQIIKDFQGDSMTGLLNATLDTIAEFSNGSPQDDDMTAILIRRNN